MPRLAWSWRSEGICRSGTKYSAGFGQSRRRGTGKLLMVKGIKTSIGGDSRYRASSAPALRNVPGQWMELSGYDPLNRVVTVTHPDGSVAKTGYRGNAAIATDENGRRRKSTVDALGRLTGLVEHPSCEAWESGCSVSGVLHYSTSYSYDLLDNLTGVMQGAQNPQTRRFGYDSPGRLICSSNPETRVGSTSCVSLPESGVERYTHDGNVSPSSACGSSYRGFPIQRGLYSPTSRTCPLSGGRGESTRSRRERRRCGAPSTSGSSGPVRRGIRSGTRAACLSRSRRSIRGSSRTKTTLCGTETGRVARQRFAHHQYNNVTDTWEYELGRRRLQPPHAGPLRECRLHRRRGQGAEPAAGNLPCACAHWRKFPAPGPKCGASRWSGRSNPPPEGGGFGNGL